MSTPEVRESCDAAQQHAEAVAPQSAGRKRIGRACYDPGMTAVGSPPPESADSSPPPLEIPRPEQPLPDGVDTIQPGGGFVMSMEQRWGALRRWRLQTFSKEYVDRMAARRRGEDTSPPHPVLDPRDLKYIRNQTDLHWAPRDNPYLRRHDWPFARWGLAELLAFTVFWFGLSLVLMIAAANVRPTWLIGL